MKKYSRTSNQQYRLHQLLLFPCMHFSMCVNSREILLLTLIYSTYYWIGTVVPNALTQYYPHLSCRLIRENLGEKNTEYTLLKPFKHEKGWSGVGEIIQFQFPRLEFWLSCSPFYTVYIYKDRIEI
jgi:hypothetical protein